MIVFVLIEENEWGVDCLGVFANYDDAKKIVKNLNIKTGLKYKEFSKNNLIPNNIPNRPERYYKKRGWVSWGDFLSTGRIANQLKNPQLRGL